MHNFFKNKTLVIFNEVNPCSMNSNSALQRNDPHMVISSKRENTKINAGLMFPNSTFCINSLQNLKLN